MADLFSDDFESGDLTAWDADVDAAATEAAALHGTYGMAVDPVEILAYVRDDTPSGETRYRARFYVDSNGITNVADDLYVRMLATTANAFFVSMRRFSGVYQIWIQSGDESGTYREITDDVHCVEIDWTRSSGTPADDGTMNLWIDGDLVEELTGIVNHTAVINEVYFGVYGCAASISGTMYYDDFASNNDGSEIGLISEEVDNAIFFGCNF